MKIHVTFEVERARHFELVTADDTLFGSDEPVEFLGRLACAARAELRETMLVAARHLAKPGASEDELRALVEEAWNWT